MVLDRIRQFIEYKEIAVSAFEKSIGMSNASLAKSMKTGGTIGADRLGNILSVYPEINLYWLVTGEGSMLTDQPEDSVVENPPHDSIVDMLFALLTDKQKSYDTLMEMLKYKDEKIEKLESELRAYREHKGETARIAEGSSSADAV